MSVGSLRAFIERPAGYVAEKTDEDTGWVYPVPDETHVHGHDAMMADVVESVPAGREPRETFRDGYAVNAILDAAYRSIRSGHWESVQAGVPAAAAPHDGRETAATPWFAEAAAILDAGRDHAGRGDRDSERLVRRRDRRRRAGPPVRHRALPDPGRGDVPPLRLVPRVQPHRGAVDDVPHPGAWGRTGSARRCSSSAPPGLAEVILVQLPVRAAGRDDRVLGQRPDRGAGRDGPRRQAPRPAGHRGHVRSPSRCPGEPEPAAGARLLDGADLVLDLCSPPADATVTIAGPRHAGRPGVHGRRRGHRQRHQGPDRRAPRGARGDAPGDQPRERRRRRAVDGRCSTKPIESMRGVSPVRSTSEEVDDGTTINRRDCAKTRGRRSRRSARDRLMEELHT